MLPPPPADSALGCPLARHSPHEIPLQFIHFLNLLLGHEFAIFLIVLLANVQNLLAFFETVLDCLLSIRFGLSAA